MISTSNQKTYGLWSIKHSAEMIARLEIFLKKLINNWKKEDSLRGAKRMSRKI